MNNTTAPIRLTRRGKVAAIVTGISVVVTAFLAGVFATPALEFWWTKL